MKTDLRRAVWNKKVTSPTFSPRDKVHIAGKKPTLHRASGEGSTVLMGELRDRTRSLKLLFEEDVKNIGILLVSFCKLLQTQWKCRRS